MHINGSITAGYTNSNTEIFHPVITQKNLLLYGAADIIAGMMSGSGGYQISHMYFQYINQTENAYTPEPINRSSGRSNFTQLGGSSNIDYLRVPILTTPRISKSPANSSDYNGNNVMFSATTASIGTVGNLSGASSVPKYFNSIGDNGPSRIFSVALVSARDIEDPASDVIFSRLNLVSPLTVIVGAHPTVYWSIRIS